MQEMKKRGVQSKNDGSKGLLSPNWAQTKSGPRKQESPKGTCKSETHVSTLLL